MYIESRRHDLYLQPNAPIPIIHEDKWLLAVMALTIYYYVATVCPCTHENNIILYCIIIVVDLNKYITLCDDVDSSKTTISKTHGARRYII